jgi:hypothetical protein
MTINFKIFVCLLIFIILCNGCNTFYKPTSVNVPFHRDANNLQVSAGYSMSGIEVQSSYSITNKFYLSGNGHYSFLKTKEDSLSSGRGGDLAIGYYTLLNANENIFFDIGLGYGLGDVNYRYLLETIPMQIRYHLQSTYHKFYVQPSLSYSYRDTDMAVTLKAVFFQYFNYKDFNNADFSNFKIGPVGYLEPVISYYTGFKNFRIFAQLGAVWPLMPKNYLSKATVLPVMGAGIHFRFDLRSSAQRMKNID